MGGQEILSAHVLFSEIFRRSRNANQTVLIPAAEFRFIRAETRSTERIPPVSLPKRRQP